MILGTQSDCKVKSITINESTATITLLVFASKNTETPKPFYVCLKDEDSQEKKLLNNKTYWIDKINSYNSDTNNVNINKYKEIIVDVDITNNNTSKISNNHWTRDCYIVLVDAQTTTQKTLWSSGKLSLVSEEFEVPKIKDVFFSASDIQTVDDVIQSKIKTQLNLSYSKTKKVSYNNKNIHATITIKSFYTKRVLETNDYELSGNEENIFITADYYPFYEPFIVEVELRNAFNESFYNIKKIYRPHRKWSNTFIKTNDGVKKVKAIYVNLEVGTFEDDNRQHEGDWL